jgi:hypothetical protein
MPNDVVGRNAYHHHLSQRHLRATLVEDGLNLGCWRAGTRRRIQQIRRFARVRLRRRHTSRRGAHRGTKVADGLQPQG